MEKTFTVTLADGTALENLKLSGNNFISGTKLTEETFKDNLGTVTITDSEGGSETHQDMALVQIQKVGTKYWFVLRELSARELLDAKTRGDIEYIAMMSGINLEEV